MSERYQILKPFSVDEKLGIAIEALTFFRPNRYRENCEVIEKKAEKSIYPMPSIDFLKFLEKKGVLAEPTKYFDRIRGLLDQLESSGILTDMGSGNNALFPKAFYFQKELTSIQSKGFLWLAAALGDEVLYGLASHAIVHITGISTEGDVRGGTGIILDPHHVLTCEHVLSGMTVDSKQTFQGKAVTVAGQYLHPKIDMGILKVEEELRPVGSLSFHPPTIGERVFVLGFPTIPLASHKALTMQHGEVTSERISTTGGDALFLFSAFARPGNSGGPVINSQGQVVGIVTRTLSSESAAYSAHYAGVPCGEIVRGAQDLGLGETIVVEDYQ